MKKSLLTLLFLLPFSLMVFSQSPFPVVSTDNAVIVYKNDRDKISTKPGDTASQKRLVQYQSNDTITSGDLWKFQSLSGSWQPVVRKRNQTWPGFFITTSSGLILSPTSVKAVYWLDGTGALWCLSNNDKLPVAKLETLQKANNAGINKAILVSDREGQSVFEAKVKISIHYIDKRQ